MSVHLSVGFSVEPYAVVRILVEHLLSYGNEVSYTIIKPEEAYYLLPALL